MLYFNSLLIYILCSANMASYVPPTASDFHAFAKLTVQRQICFARTAKTAINTKIYIYVTSPKFDDAESVTINGVRCLRTKDNRFAVLSPAAQEFLSPFDFRSFSDIGDHDDIGYFI